MSVANTAFPNSDGRRQWRHLTGDGAKKSTLPSGYNSQAGQYHWSVGPSKTKSMYWAHGDNAGPTIYRGKLYVHRGNAIVAFGPGGLGSDAAVLPAASAPSGGVKPDPLSEAALQERLRAEVRKIVDAGHLNSGFAKIGLIDFMTVNTLGQHLLHYWHNPAETLLTLTRALPHLPAALQNDVRQYLQKEYASFPPYKYSHIGFKDGAPREPFDYPPSTARIFEHDFGPLPRGSFRGWSKPPDNVYALWKYAQAGLGEPAVVFGQAAGVIGSTPEDEYLAAFPHVHNAYIAGYIGYVGLAKMAGQPCSTQEAELNRLLELRARTFRWDVPANTGRPQSDQYFYTLIMAWNFMFLVPELADYLRRNALPKVQEAVGRYTRMTPYWMAGHNEEVQHENGLTPLQQTHALFQAKAQILEATREELAGLLDTPTVPIGDLYYLQNLIATIEAPQRERR